MKKFLLPAISCAAILLSAGAAGADVITLNFEGVNAAYPSGFSQVLDYYNGGVSSDGTAGTNYGISFPENALAICLNTPGISCSNTSRGGLGDPASQQGGLFFLDGSNTYLNMAAGFDTGFSFVYTAVYQGGAIEVYSEINGGGTLLATLNLTTTDSDCDGTYAAAFCPFVAAGVTFSGIAKSISFGGVANQIVFDDVTFGSEIVGGPGTSTGVPEPLTLSLFGAGLAGTVVARRRKAKA